MKKASPLLSNQEQKMKPELREQLYTMILAADALEQMPHPSRIFSQSLVQVIELLNEMSQDWYYQSAMLEFSPIPDEVTIP